MPVNLTSFPRELLNKVFENVDKADQVRLSVTCSQFRAAVAPFVFHTVNFTAGGPTSTAGSALLVVRKYGALIRELRAVVPSPVCTETDCWCRPVADEWAPTDTELAEDIADDQGRWLNPNTAVLLTADCAMLPGRPRLSPRFLADGDEDSHSTEIFERGEVGGNNIFDSRLAEKSNRRAGAMSEALVEGQFSQQKGAAESTGAFRALSIFNFAPPYGLDVFDGEPWRWFLGGIKDFELSLFGQGEWDHIIDLPVYRSFLKQLDHIFFRNLHAVERLSLETPVNGPMGFRVRGVGKQFLPFGNGFSQMPALRELKLVNVMVGPGLAERLRSDLTRDFFKALFKARVPIRKLHVDRTDSES
ncbi:hypothetical protein MCOR19_004925 [Pyricularia oryzae]|nr:hypothetical protein MCOR19_004925 [Pyricularia oryzae]KAI6323029.1 hypothetical protein MCOR30_007430 [Pyricularia oryzae]KAI6468240.1 hypothetical protein MCOR15_002226 [Pyricularia oryzae]KAI6493554.1 hypothetical protein MCOR18_001427 [Pyricularia oryzae]KAI6539531.1 hypothetical protein MCOR16_001304 [Pyricularia oryzae]